MKGLREYIFVAFDEEFCAVSCMRWNQAISLETESGGQRNTGNKALELDLGPV